MIQLPVIEKFRLNQTLKEPDHIDSIHATLLRWSLSLAAVGMSLSLFATYDTIKAQQSIFNRPLFCITASFTNCSVVHTSSTAMPMGIPLAWLGFLYYLSLFVTIGMTLMIQYWVRPATTMGLFVSLLALFISIFLASILTLQLHAFCAICFSLYAVNILLCLLFLRVRDVSVFSFGWTKLLLGELFDHHNRRVLIGLCCSHTFIFVVGILGMGYAQTSFLSSGGIDVDEELARHFQQPKQTFIEDALIPVSGDSKGSVDVVVVSDFQCAYCRFASVSLRKVLSEFSDTRLRFVNYPLDRSVNPFTPNGAHDEAGLAARAALCSQMFGDFWGYHDEVFANQDRINRDFLFSIAARRGWQQRGFCHCMDSDSTLSQLQKQIQLAHEAHVMATPSVFINGRLLRYWNNSLMLRTIIRLEQSERQQQTWF